MVTPTEAKKFTAVFTVVVGQMASAGCPARRIPVLLLDVPAWTKAANVETGLIAVGVSAGDLIKGNNSVVSVRRSPGSDKGGTARFDIPFPAAI